MSKPYRSNAGIVVFNNQKQVLVGERVHYPGMFQFPQGGLEESESALEGAIRELYEETGLVVTPPPAGELGDWVFYDFPEDIPAHLRSYKGQRQKWFFFFWEGDPETLQLDLHEREFIRMIWMDLDRVVDEIIDFKKPVYEVIRRAAPGIMKEYFGNRTGNF